MPKFATTGAKAAVVTAGLGPLVITSPATVRRGKLCYFAVSSSDTPIDQAITIQVQRCTAAGTSTAVTLAAAHNLDAGDLTAATAVVGSNITGTPTIAAASAALLIKQTFNQKYGMVYVPPSDDASIWYPAVSASGLVWDTPVLNAATASNINVNAHIHEA